MKGPSNRYGILIAVSILLIICSACAKKGPDPLQALAKYDVIWDSPSRDSWGTMPTGNGDIGLNVWVEESGDLLFYIGKTDLWDDNSRLLKLGRIRFKISPNPYLQSRRFFQTLRLRDATVEVRYGEGEDLVRVQVWVDAHHPVIHVLVEGGRLLEVNAAIEIWRTAPFELPTIEVSDVQFDQGVAGNQHSPTIVEPDTVLTGQESRIGWYHHNTKSVGPALSAELREMEGFAQPDPILNRTFGAVITANRVKKIDDLNLLSSGASSHDFEIYVLTRHPSTPQEWLQAVDETVAAVRKIPLARYCQAQGSWWQELWSRLRRSRPGGTAGTRCPRSRASWRSRRGC